MKINIATDRKANLLGSLWMIAAMAGFAVEDTLLKAATETLSLGQVLIMFGLGGAFVFACVLLLRRQPLYVPDVVSKPMRVRVFFEITARMFCTLAISLMPLSAATVIMQATPLVVVIGAALFFGEKVGWRRWTAIVVGLIGVLIIIQPGTDSFSALSIIAVIGVLGFAGRDLASRAAPASLSTSILGLYGFVAIAVAGGLFLVWQPAAFLLPSIEVSLFLLGAVLFGVGSYTCLMIAMRTGEVSAVTPFRYTRLIFGIALGIAIFGEQLTLSMVIGSGLIVLSGLFILWRSKQVAAAK